MKLIIAAGGGGHFSPALATIQNLSPDDRVLVIGRKYSLEADKTIALEYQLAQKLGIPYISITTARLQRKFSKHTILSLLKLPFGFLQAYKILHNFKPDVVLSFGGYISIPVVIVAHRMGIPVVIHEQTVDAGMANKIASRFAKKICISWESSRQFFPKEKTVLTGNPLRKAILEQLQPSPKSKTAEQVFALPKEQLPLLYITGGSIGSHEINRFIEGCLEQLLQKYRIIHQTGDAQQFKDYERLKALKNDLDPKLQKKYYLKKFLSPEEVGTVLLEADLVISRCGMSTMTELLYLGKPCLLIPLPSSAHGEQMKNAQFLKGVGIAEISLELETSPDTLYAKINEMIQSLEKYKNAGEKSRDLVQKDAAQTILTIVRNEISQIV